MSTLDDLSTRVGELETIRAQLSDIRGDRSTLKMSADELEQCAVSVLLDNDIPYVDTSGVGTGPFWVLTRTTTGGGCTKEQYLDFFGILLEHISNKTVHQENVSPQECYHLLRTFTGQFKKRSVTLSKTNQCRYRSTAEIKQWLDGDTEP